MKKIINLILFLFLFIWLSSAYSIWDVSVSFCNSKIWTESRALNFVAKAWEPYEFCVEFSNNSKEKVPLSLGFVDWQLTNSESKNKACSHQGRLFGPYVDFMEEVFDIPSFSKIQKTGFLNFPIWYSGEVNWCLVYTISNDKKNIEQWWSFFDVIVRKANFMDWYVVWEFNRNLIFMSWNISYYIDKQNNDLVISLPFVSSWIIPEFIQFTWIIKNSLGYERTVSKAQLISWYYNLLINFDDVPFYKWWYDFSFEAISVLDTRLDLSYLSDLNKKPFQFSLEKKIILVPWKLIAILIWFVLVLILFKKIINIFRK